MVGSGQVSVTGRYESKKDSFGIDTAFATDDNNTLYGSYMVTDERISSLGLETGFNLTSTKRVTIDTTYFPPSDAARLKVLLRQGKMKLAGTWQAPSLKSLSATSGDVLQQVKCEFETKLSPMETLKLGFDSKTKAAKAKYARKLDAKNKVDMEYAYPGTSSSSSAGGGRGNSAVTVKLSHTYSPKHSFSTAFNYGTKKIAAEWEWKTDKGPWTINASFPFNARYVMFLRERERERDLFHFSHSPHCVLCFCFPQPEDWRFVD